jgi:nicotinamidase-related amidase
MMAANNPLLNNLVNYDDSVLIVIDVQDSFLAKLPVLENRQLVSRVSWLVQVATALDIPVIVTAEDIPNMGGVSTAVGAKLSPDTPIYNKMVFGLIDNPEILQAVQDTGRRTAILVGLETDVCIAHSAIGLLGLDYQVAVVADAVGSPGEAHQCGLARMKAAGVMLTNIKSLYYEWVRTVKRSEELGEQFGKEWGFPEGITF